MAGGSRFGPECGRQCAIQIISRRNEALEAHSSHVLIDSGEVQNFSEEKTVYVIVHELLHALGFSGHTDPQRFPDATLNPNIPRNLPPSLLSLIDREALFAAYGRFRPGTQPEQISAENLGPWDEASFHVRGGSGNSGRGGFLRRRFQERPGATLGLRAGAADGSGAKRGVVGGAPPGAAHCWALRPLVK